MKTSLLLSVATVAAVVASAGMHPARADLATIESTCRAGADAARAADRHFSPIFCRRRLAAHPGAADADVPGLARIAAVLGAGNADAARHDAGRLLKRSRDARYRGALEQCDRLFASVRGAFAAAEAAVVDRRYAAVRDTLERATDTGFDCSSAFSSANVGPSPLWNYTIDNVQYAFMCIGITSLINTK
ncbi:hypothetical protein ACP70R_013367 [Stipagrostis hirtigluma subsp. patula]